MINFNINNNNKFILNLKAIKYCIFYKDWFINYKIINNKFIIIINNLKIKIKEIKNISFKLNNNNILLKKVNYIFSLKITLINFKELINKG